MARYRLKKLLLRGAIALPAPASLARLCRLYHDAREGQNVGDMTINGELRLLRQQAPGCRVLFDVGAHHGEWTRHALRANPRARVHCFEPISSHYAALRAARFPEAVTCNRCGLSDAAGERPIDVATASLHRLDGGAGDEVEVIALRTLDGYCRENGVEHIDFLKVDVEGHELAVLHGGRRMIGDARVARIQFEYGPCNADSRVLLRDLFAFFEPLDYDLFRITPRRLLPTTYERRLENLQYKNFVALHRSLRRQGG